MSNTKTKAAIFGMLAVGQITVAQSQPGRNVIQPQQVQTEIANVLNARYGYGLTDLTFSFGNQSYYSNVEDSYGITAINASNARFYRRPGILSFAFTEPSLLAQHLLRRHPKLKVVAKFFTFVDFGERFHLGEKNKVMLRH